MVLSVTRGWREHSTGKANGREAGDGRAASDRGLAWAAGVEYDLPTNSGAELQVSRMRRSCAGIQRVKQLCRQQREWRGGRWRARAQRYRVERDEAGEETTDPAGPGGFQTWDIDQDFKQGVFSLPRGDGRGWVGGGDEGSYCCSGCRTGPRATLVPLLHGDSEAASGEPVGPQGFLR